MAVVKTILKRYSGTAWDELYLKTVSDIVEVGKAINLANAVAGYNTSDSIAATDSVQTVIEKLAYPLVQLDKVTVPGIQGNVTTIQGDITNLKSGDAITSLAASKIQGVLDLANIPQGALERVGTVADSTARKALTTTQIQTGDVCKEEDTGLMYFVVDDTKLAEDEGWMAFTAGAATSVPWSGVTEKPTTLDGYGITDAVKAADTATTGANKVLKTNAEGKIEVDTTGNAATATNVAFTGITGLDASVTAEALKNAVAQMHEHANKASLDKIGESAGVFTYNSEMYATRQWVEENAAADIPLVASVTTIEGMSEGDLAFEQIGG